MITYQQFEMQFCPECQTKFEPGDEPYSVRCPRDNKQLFFNPSPCVNIYIVKNKQVLLGKRAIEPFKGQPDSIGGFVDTGENLEEAAIRETREETGLEIVLGEYIGSIKEYYGDKSSPLVCVGFAAKMKNESDQPKPGDDIAELFWHSLAEPMPNFPFTNASYFYKQLASSD